MRKRDRALRRAVVRLQGCLGRVPRAERRVLVLRAGVGIAHTRSRTRVARITGLRRARIAQLERRGLRHLRALGRAGVCAVAAAATPAVVAELPTPGSPQSGGGPGERGSAPAERSEGARQHSEESREGSQPKELPLGQPGSVATGGSSFDLTILLVPLALAIFALALLREVRRPT